MARWSGGHARLRVIRRDASCYTQQPTYMRKPAVCCRSFVYMWVPMDLLGSSRLECVPVVTCRNSRIRKPRSRAKNLGQLAFAPWHTRAPPACRAAESARENRRPQEKRFVFRKKKCSPYVSKPDIYTVQ